MSAGAETTLQEQINNAEAGTTVTLTENVTVDQTILINKNITIDGAGHTITSSVKNILGTFYVNVSASNFTITNATIDGNNTASMAVCAYRGEAKGDYTGVVSVVNNNTGNIITLTDCTVKNFTGYPGSYVGAVYAFSTSTVNLNNCTFTGNTTKKSADGASGADVWAGAAATVYISGGSFGEVFVNSNAVNKATITVSNGAKIEELAVCVTEKGAGETNQPAITINNATVTDIATETGNDLPSSAVTLEGTGTVTNLPGHYVAKIGDKKYETLTDAIAAATSGQTIALIEDVTLSSVVTIAEEKDFTLDLNGKVLTGKLTNNGTLVIKSSVDGGKMFRSSTSGNVIGNNTATASLTIESGTIELDGAPSFNGAITNKGTLLIKGGEIISGKYPVYLSGGKCEIAGGTLTSANGSLQVNIVDGGLKAPESVYSNATATYTGAESGYAYTFGGAMKVVANGETVTLTKDVSLTTAQIINRNISLTLNLGGHNITSSGTALLIGNGTLTIEGEGSVKGNINNTQSQPAVYADGGNVIINNGIFDNGGIEGNGSSTIYADGSSTVTINDGTFKNSATSQGGKYWVLNTKDESSAKIVVNGGSFYNFDPANNVNDGNTGSGTNYLADGKITELSEFGSDKIYTVKDGQWLATINDLHIDRFRFATLDDAITTANGAGKDITITLLENATATVEPVVSVTIDAAGKELTLPTFNVTDGVELSYANVINATDNIYKVTTATYNRTGAAGTQWGTVCLPFAFETAPDGYTLYTPTTVGDNVLNVSEVSYPIAAGTPLIFYKDNTDEAIITSSNASVKIGATPTAQSGTLALAGTFENKTITEGLANIYYINGDKFHQAKASLSVPAYRAYINYSVQNAKPIILSILIGGETTGLENTSVENASATAIYDMNGLRLSAPKKGVNIMKMSNGKTVKLIIK